MPIAKAIKAITTCQVIVDSSINCENRSESSRTQVVARLEKLLVFEKILFCASDI
jgi:hypothetical protein